MRRKSSDRSKLIKRHLERASWKDSSYRYLPGSKNRGTGIYVLYNGDNIHYIGLSKKSLRGRLKQHMNDRHSGKWDNFSFYQILRKKYIKDIETLLLRIFYPPGNRKKGTFRSKYNLKVKKNLLERLQN